MKPDASEAAMAGLSDLSSQEHNFEAVFQVPSSHRLVAVRSRTQGGMTTTVVWEHDEYDDSGQLVARYKSYEQVSATGEIRGGAFSSGQQKVCSSERTSRHSSEDQRTLKGHTSRP